MQPTTAEDPHLRRGEALLHAGQPAEAAILFRDATRRLPGQGHPWVLLASALLDAGDGKGAWRAARRAVLHAPTSPAAQRVLGRALFAAGFPEPAVEALTRAAQLAGDDVGAWYELGLACEGAGLPGASTAALRRAAEIDPAHGAATARLARRVRLSGDDEEAESLLRAALDRTPDSIDLRLELVSLLRAERPHDALSVLDGTRPSDPSQQDAVALHRAMVLIELARYDEAGPLVSAMAQPPPGLTLSWLLGRLQLAVAEGAEERAKSAAETLAHAANRPAEDLDRRITAHFQLSQFWFRRNDPDRAFALLAAGHGLARQAQPYVREMDARLVEASVTRLAGDRLHRGPRAANRSETPVFIVGMPRSGTTLTEQILAAHPAVHGAGERTALARSFLRLGRSDDMADCVARLAELPQPALDAEAALYLEALAALAPGHTRIIDKMPANFRFLGLVALMLPGARIIHCVRDPRDIGFSIWSRRFRGAHPYAHDLRDLGWYIGQHHRLMDHWHASLPNPIMRIHLHSWIRDFDGTLRRVLEFLDLPYDPACERFYELDRSVRTASRHQVREAINARGMSRWRLYTTQLAPLIEALQETGVLPVGAR
jgi:tetratricopeptide (TPR) repeat protein